jgi:hypothetical protein
MMMMMMIRSMSLYKVSYPAEATFSPLSVARACAGSIQRSMYVRCVFMHTAGLALGMIDSQSIARANQASK